MIQFCSFPIGHAPGCSRHERRTPPTHVTWFFQLRYRANVLKSLWQDADRASGDGHKHSCDLEMNVFHHRGWGVGGAAYISQKNKAPASPQLCWRQGRREMWGHKADFTGHAEKSHSCSFSQQLNKSDREGVREREREPKVVTHMWIHVSNRKLPKSRLSNYFWCTKMWDYL